ncbi:hypothetical protein B0H19DRAFT_1074163 [Mycena capillaripes]|nr:hypothetical protein B0H19DRAFT_1074163 [Mycena capillaripes]
MPVLRMCIIGLKGPNASLDALQFCATCSGCKFSPWEDISIQTFNIAAAISNSRELNAGQSEDLAELDSGTPVHALTSLSITPAPPDPTPAKTSCSRNKAHSKLKCATDEHHSRLSTYSVIPVRSPRFPSFPASTIGLLLFPASGVPIPEINSVDALLDARPHHLRHYSKSLPPIKASFELRKVRVAATGWIGLCDNGVAPEEAEAAKEDDGPEPTHTLPNFFGPNANLHSFCLVPYLGPSSWPIVDAIKKVCAVFGGMPDDPDYMAKVHDPALKLMEEACTKMSVVEEREFHRRGCFLQLTGSDSHGGRQVQPGTLINGVINTAIFLSLISSDPFIRLAGFATGLFANWRPIYLTSVSTTWAFSTTGILIFITHSSTASSRAPSIWDLKRACVAIGTLPTSHQADAPSLRLGTMTTRKLIIEFPPGCTILIPSAAIFHSNIPIAAHKRRYSFTQYTSGGLFRWVEHGFCTEEEYFDSLTAPERKEEKELGHQRATEGADMFSTIDELKAM